MRAPLVVVVGVCAAGKTTLVDGLRAEGYSALEVAQEHSDLPYLWARSDPSFLVYLEAPDELVQQRRSYLDDRRLNEERRYLSYARAKADLTVDTRGKSADEVRNQVVAALDRAGIERIPYQPERPLKNWQRWS